MSKVKIFPIFVFLGFAQGVVLGQATIRVQVFDPFGRPIPDAYVRLLGRDGAPDLAPSPGGLTFSGVPFGTYNLLAIAGSMSAQRGISVNVKDLVVRLGLSFPAGERTVPAGDLAISGDLNASDLDADGDWWVRADGIYLPVRREALVSHGAFLIGGLEMGAYLVEVFRGAELRHIEVVEIDPKEPRKRLKIIVLRMNGPSR